MPSNTSAHIQISGVSKRYGEHNALRRIDLDIAKGEFFSLLGPSGCGKTTLLKILGGFEDPSTGEVYIDGEMVNAVPPHKRRTNMVFQSYALFPHLDVAGNIGYGLRRSALSTQEKRDKVQGLVDLMQLDGLQSRNVETLSGGQRQRVALARALAMDPSVLLLDEPLGALDKKLRDEMQTELRSIQQRVGITFVFVTHDQEEAMALSDRVAVLFDGEIAQVDTPRGLYDRPLTEAIASFIGNINLLDAMIETVGADGIDVDVPGVGRARVNPPKDHGFSVGDRARLAIRPEQIRVGKAISAGPGLSGNARITTVSFRGDRNHLHLTVDGIKAPLGVVLPNLAVATGTSLEIGQQISFQCPQEGLLLLK